MSDYVGTELEVFKLAVNWKTYYGRLIAPFLGPSVAEVGAGLGINTELFCTDRQESWVCLEPDRSLAQKIQEEIDQERLPGNCEVLTGTIRDLPEESRFDSILYVDVLEHIEDDAGEVERALGFLNPGGHLIIMGPAHQFLFSPFDADIGHFRRYDKARLREIVPAPARCVTLQYLDSAGMLLSLGNRLLLKQRQPTAKQILFWDQRVVPVSRILDGVFGHRIGKSILGVWQK